MAYFVSIDGKVCTVGSKKQPYPLHERGLVNYFVRKMDAYTFRDILELWEPMIFYGNKQT